MDAPPPAFEATRSGRAGTSGRSAPGLCKNDERGAARRIHPAGSDESPGTDPTPASPEPSDLRVELGHAIFGLVDPHRGHEIAWNRYYERDHLVAAGIVAPWTLAIQRWVATRREKALRYPATGPIADPTSRGTFLATIWIQQGRYDDQQLWVADQMKILAQHGRTFEKRDVITIAGYDYLGGALRAADGVPPELALDRRYPGLVLAWAERRPGHSLEELRRWLTTELLPGVVEKSEIAMALCFTPRPKAPWWPKAAPGTSGAAFGILVAVFGEAHPIAGCDPRFAPPRPASDARGRTRTRLEPPRVRGLPGG